MVDDIDLANLIFEKCKNIMPLAYEGAHLVGVNERMRFLKYDHPGAKFEAHCDGSFPRSNLERSLITLQIYLDEHMEGGETTFFDDAFSSVKMNN